MALYAETGSDHVPPAFAMTTPVSKLLFRVVTMVSDTFSLRDNLLISLSVVVRYPSRGKTLLGSAKPFAAGLMRSVGIPAMVPKITGNWESEPSRKNPSTQVPSTIPVGDCPTPEMAADVMDWMGVAQGKSAVGSNCLSSV